MHFMFISVLVLLEPTQVNRCIIIVDVGSGLPCCRSHHQYHNAGMEIEKLRTVGGGVIATHQTSADASPGGCQNRIHLFYA